MKKITLILLSSIFVRGEMFKEGKEVEVNEREAKELLGRGLTRLPEDDDNTKSIEEMTNKELTNYATELGLEVGKSMNKDALIALINGDNISL